jgi:AcrR family transcriptional regulator
VRAAIVDAGRQLFRTGGQEAVSMRNVAGKVGYAVGALYRYFPDTRSLLLHVWEDDMRYAAEYVRGATDNVDEPVEKVRQTFLSYLRYWTQNPDTFRNLFGTMATDFDRRGVPDFFPATGPMALYFETRDPLAAALKGKKNAPRDADVAMQCLLSAVHGIMALSLSAAHFPWFDLQQLAAVTIDSMLCGWGVIDRPKTLASAITRRPRPSVPSGRAPAQKRSVP